MKPEDKLALSFYREVEPIGKKDNVFLVRHSETGEFFVKKIYTHYDSDIYKFLSENRLYGIPGIRLTIHDDDKLIVIEEYINGSTLQDIVEKQGKIFAPNEVAGILSRLCEILQQFHNATPQLVHRDIKPSNIIISQTGEIFLTDFNISRQVKENKNTDTEIMGTFGYAAPEQYGFEQCTDKTDIYALGVLTKYLLTGNNNNLHSYRGPMCRIIQKATRLSPDERYQNISQMKRAFTSVFIGIKDSIRFVFNTRKKQIAAILYTLFAIALSYSSAKDYTPDLDFPSAFISDIILLMSPLAYFWFISAKGIRFSKNKTKHRWISLAVYCLFVFILIILIGFVLMLYSKK